MSHRHGVIATRRRNINGGTTLNLIVGSTGGGTVLNPGEGTFQVEPETTALLEAIPLDPDNSFVGWSQIIETSEGYEYSPHPKVEIPGALSTGIFMDEDAEVIAVFAENDDDDDPPKFYDPENDPPPTDDEGPIKPTSDPPFDPPTGWPEYFAHNHIPGGRFALFAKPDSTKPWRRGSATCFQVKYHDSDAGAWFSVDEQFVLARDTSLSGPMAISNELYDDVRSCYLNDDEAFDMNTSLTTELGISETIHVSTTRHHSIPQLDEDINMRVIDHHLKFRKPYILSASGRAWPFSCHHLWHTPVMPLFFVVRWGGTLYPLSFLLPVDPEPVKLLTAQRYLPNKTLNFEEHASQAQKKTPVVPQKTIYLSHLVGGNDTEKKIGQTIPWDSSNLLPGVVTQSVPPVHSPQSYTLPRLELIHEDGSLAAKIWINPYYGTIWINETTLDPGVYEIKLVLSDCWNANLGFDEGTSSYNNNAKKPTNLPTWKEHRSHAREWDMALIKFYYQTGVGLIPHTYSSNAHFDFLEEVGQLVGKTSTKLYIVGARRPGDVDPEGGLTKLFGQGPARLFEVDLSNESIESMVNWDIPYNRETSSYQFHVYQMDPSTGFFSIWHSFGINSSDYGIWDTWGNCLRMVEDMITLIPMGNYDELYETVSSPIYISDNNFFLIKQERIRDIEYPETVTDTRVILKEGLYGGNTDLCSLQAYDTWWPCLPQFVSDHNGGGFLFGVTRMNEVARADVRSQVTSLNGSPCNLCWIQVDGGITNIVNITDEIPEATGRIIGVHYIPDVGLFFAVCNSGQNTKVYYSNGIDTTLLKEFSDSSHPVYSYHPRALFAYDDINGILYIYVYLYAGNPRVVHSSMIYQLSITETGIGPDGLEIVSNCREHFIYSMETCPTTGNLVVMANPSDGESIKSGPFVWGHLGKYDGHVWQPLKDTSNDT